MKRLILFLFTHGIALAAGFGLGIYLLPILTAPEGPDSATLDQQARNALFSAEFTRDLRGSDFLHWGEGTLSVTPTQIVHKGALSPGPDYKLYLTETLVEHEDDFDPATALRIGDIKTFEGFILDVPAEVDVNAYTSVLVWCESFSEFITAAKYR